MDNSTEIIAMNGPQAARALGVTNRTLHNWRRRGILVATKVGGKTLYNVEDLRRLVPPRHGADPLSSP